MNDEKLNLAEEYLLTKDIHGQEFEAAIEHIRWTWLNKPENRDQCKKILLKVLDARNDRGLVKAITEALA